MYHHQLAPVISRLRAHYSLHHTIRWIKPGLVEPIKGVCWSLLPKTFNWTNKLHTQETSSEIIRGRSEERKFPITSLSSASDFQDRASSRGVTAQQRGWRSCDSMPSAREFHARQKKRDQLSPKSTSMRRKTKERQEERHYRWNDNCNYRYVFEYLTKLVQVLCGGFRKSFLMMTPGASKWILLCILCALLGDGHNSDVIHCR